ncbi:concanavalin A-like lectin/glucanase [Coprinellus micaceus]|uniref:Concanavalin A-like lectin/glucanase n=1 Tax=Coprinellus micaceus TaxID=71717 RepID=A0A4Y7TJH1_COPMI|nr:concanavalin A-like lectin/glucanase [Coprinellus micaceus]
MGTAQVIQGATECTEARGFNVCQNLVSPASGSNYQTSAALRAATFTIAWSTEYNWSGSDGKSVKSFANVESKAATGLQLNLLPLMTTLWKWRYEGQDKSLKAVVALDILIGSGKQRVAATPAKSFEVKIWLANTGGYSKPVGYKIAEVGCIAGYDWYIWRGVAGLVQTITFVNQNPNEEITEFDGDLTEFMSSLRRWHDPTAHHPSYIQSVKAGNEVYSGAAQFYSPLYQLWVEFPAE